MRIAVRSLLYGFILFAAAIVAILLGVTLETWLSVALTGDADTPHNLITLLIGSLVVGLVTAFVLEDL